MQKEIHDFPEGVPSPMEAGANVLFSQFSQN